VIILDRKEIQKKKSSEFCCFTASKSISQTARNYYFLGEGKGGREDSSSY